MSSSDSSAQTQLIDAWREQGADRVDPTRFRFIEALQQRAAEHRGEARRVLDDRLSQLIKAYAGDIETSASHAGNSDSAATSATPRGALGDLLDYATNQAMLQAGDPDTDTSTPHDTYPELAALDDFRSLWSKLQTENQIRQSLEQDPTDAGPLNSGRLVHRSLTLMRELSPGYLRQFLSYVDTLSWMEQMTDGGALPAREAPKPVNPRKRSRSSRSA